MAKSLTSKTGPLFRSESDKLIGGVCGGIAEYFEVDSTLIRLIFIAFILLGGSGGLLYLILWVIIPSKSNSGTTSKEALVESTKPAPQTSKSIKNQTHGNSKALWGLLLIIAGLIMLLQNFGFADILMLNKTWPALLIVLGFLILK